MCQYVILVNNLPEKYTDTYSFLENGRFWVRCEIPKKHRQTLEHFIYDIAERKINMENSPKTKELFYLWIKLLSFQNLNQEEVMHLGSN